MTGIATIIENINKKYSELKKAKAKMNIDIQAFKSATALQLKQFSEGMTKSLNKLAEAYNVMSKGVDERFKIIEKKPCMDITEILTEEELLNFRNLIK